ncbi:MAG: hypothetical protein K8F54_02325, partial [Altibacter sp.]|uniref:WD40/YVTN/BNR-like repeat-containing protein n=1 Tax=Altibacter sp. TaxID=2024823 RepID=UPI001DE1913A
MKYKLLLLFVFLLYATNSQSQEYLQMIEAETFTVQEIIDNAEAYFANRDKGKGSGYYNFKRWEYSANRLKNEDGYLPTVAEQLAEIENFNAYLNNNPENGQMMNDNWQELGPDYFNQTASWSPGVGRITSVAIDAGNNNHMIVGANTGGVWRTTDGGANWTPVGDYFSNLDVYSVAIDPNNSSTYFFGSISGLIYKSTDSGATWNQIADLSNSQINKILIDPSNSNKMFACSQNTGFYRTTDGGASWNQITSDIRAYDIEFKPGDLSVVYATGNGFQRSTDGGATFTTVGGFSTGAKMMGVSADDASVVYVLEASGSSFAGLYKSTNSGVSFTQLNHAGRNYFTCDANGTSSGGQAPRDMDIAVNPNDVDEVHIAGCNTWRSLDAGVSFTLSSIWLIDTAAATNIGYCHADVDIMEFVSNGTLYVGTDGGIFKATNTGTLNSNYYTDLTDGLGIRQFYKIGVSQTPDVIVTGGSQDNGSSFYTLAGGWKDWIGADGMEGFVDKDNSSIMYGMIQYGAMYRTNNAGTSIINLPEPPPGQGEWVSPFEQDPTVTNTVYCAYRRVYKSTTQGTGWVSISQDFGGNLDHLKIAPSNNQVMYVANGGLMYKTTDGGTTNWVQTTNPGGTVNSIAIHPTNPNKVAVAVNGGNHVFVTNDGGTTWQNYGLNLPNFTALSVIWDDNGHDGLYLGMNYGLFYID